MLLNSKKKRTSGRNIYIKSFYSQFSIGNGNLGKSG